VKKALQDKVSRERIGKEISGMMQSSQSISMAAFRLLHQLHLLPIVLALPSNLEPPIEVNEKFWDDCMLRMECMNWYLSQRQQRNRNGTMFDNVRHLLLSACISSIHSQTYKTAPPNKEKVSSASSFIVIESLKWTNHDAQQLQLYHSSFPILIELSLHTPPSRLQVGLELRKIGKYWRGCLFHSLVVRLVEVSKWKVPETTNHQTTTECESVLRQFEDLENYIDSLELEGVWDMKPLLNGKEVMELLGVKGPRIGDVLKDLIAYQLQHPSSNVNQAREWLITNYDPTITTEIATNKKRKPN